jgi:hypothetical protein
MIPESTAMTYTSPPMIADTTQSSLSDKWTGPLRLQSPPLEKKYISLIQTTTKLFHYFVTAVLLSKVSLWFRLRSWGTVDRVQGKLQQTFQPSSWSVYYFAYKQNTASTMLFKHSSVTFSHFPATFYTYAINIRKQNCVHRSDINSKGTCFTFVEKRGKKENSARLVE